MAGTGEQHQDAEAGARRDIESRADIEALVRAFYDAAFADPMIGYLFTDVAKLDLDEHLPVITSYWETILLGAGTYAGGAFAKHARLHAQSPLRGGHFARWLTLWCGTVDALHEGPRAAHAKATAHRVAAAFASRLGAGSVPGAPAPAPRDDTPFVLPIAMHRPPAGDG